MIKDTIDPKVWPDTKPLRPADDIATSLIALRDELWERKHPELREVFWKINSCLYREYPRRPKRSPVQAESESEIEEYLRHT